MAPFDPLEQMTARHQPLSLEELFRQPGTKSMLDERRITAAREHWRTAVQHQAPSAIVAAFFDQYEQIPESPRRQNEYRAAAQRPVDARFCKGGMTRRQIAADLKGAADALDEEVERLLQQTGVATSSDELRNILQDLRDLCGVDHEAVHVAHRALIAKLVKCPFDIIDAPTELMQLLQRGKLKLADALEANPHATAVCDILNAAHAVVARAVGDPTWRPWCRNFLLGCMALQERALSMASYASAHAEIAQALTLNKRQLAALEQQLAIPQLSAADGGAADVWGADLARVIDQLPATSPLREIATHKLALARSGTGAEAIDARDYLGWLRKVPELRHLLAQPQAVTAQSPRARNAPVSTLDAVRAARTLFADRIVGQEDLCETLMNRLGVILERESEGFNVAFLGPPGVAKTEVAKLLADIFHKPFVKIQGESLNTKGQIGGNEGMYRNTAPGALAQALLNSDVAPIIFVDEFGKACPEAQQALASAMDRKNCKSYTDAWLGNSVKLDFSQVIFVLAGNVGEALDDSIIDRANVFTFNALTETEKLAVFDKLWPSMSAERGVPPDVVIGAPAKRVIVNKDRENPGARQISNDIGALCDWLHTLKLRDELPRYVDAIVAKRVIEGTWVDVAEFPEGHGAAADIRFGSVGLQKKAVEAVTVFKALERNWRLTLQNSLISLEQLSGSPFFGHHAVAVRDPQQNSTHRFWSLHRQRYFKKKLVGEFEPPLPTPGSEKVAALMTSSTALQLRLVFIQQTFWNVKKALEEGMERKLPATQRFAFERETTLRN